MPEKKTEYKYIPDEEKITFCKQWWDKLLSVQHCRAIACASAIPISINEEQAIKAEEDALALADSIREFREFRWPGD